MKNKKILRLVSTILLLAAIAFSPSHSVSADPGLVISSTSLTTTEGGSAVYFSVSLSETPSQEVSISVTSSEGDEGTVSPGTLIFTTVDWNNAQTVSVTPVDDFIDDGNVNYVINLAVTASGPEYQSVSGQVFVTNIDDDTAGITVTPVSGPTTNEAGGEASFTVRLTSQPISEVVLSVGSSDPSEGTPDKTTLTFTAGNWNTLQTVKVLGQDDEIDDGDQPYIVSVAPQSGPAQYMSLDPVEVGLTNIDDDTASLIVDPTSGLITSEGGANATFTVRLATQPTAAFILAVNSQDATEGSVSPTSITFTTSNWSDPQTVTVSGVDDAVVDGTVNYDVRLQGTSGAPEYVSLSALFISVQNQDNDSIDVIVDPTSGLVTTEAGGTAQFNVKLASQPTSPVTINLNSSRPEEGLPLPNSLQLNSTNWASGVTVTVIGQNDNVDEDPDNQPYKIILSNTISSDTNYDNLATPDVNVVNVDDDIAGFTVSETSLTTKEDGTSATFKVFLNTQPAQNVTFNISSMKISEGIVSPNSLMFTPSNYLTAQTVTVTGVDDPFVDGNQSFEVYVDPSSTDPKYSALVTVSVWVTNQDDDVAGFTISPLRKMATSEEGTTDRFSVRLNASPNPGKIVKIPLTSNDLTEGAIASPTSKELVFSSSNWMTPQEVIIVGIDDDLADGDKDYQINVGPSVSNELPFNNLAVKKVNAANSDNDTAGIFFSQTDGLITTESGNTALFSVRLNTKPLDRVTVAMVSTDPSEGLITIPASPHVLVFTPDDWNTSKSVTLTGIDDILVDGDIPYEIHFSVNSSGSDYNGLSVDPIQVLNLDDDFSPVAVEDKYYINAEALEIAPPGVLWNDSDANDDVLSAVLEMAPVQDPDILFNSDGSFTYQANLGFEGVDRFTYRAFDGISYSDFGVVNIEVDLTPPSIANWISPVTNDKTYSVETGTVILHALPENAEDFGYIWYAWYNSSLPGGVEDQLVSLGSADSFPYTVSLDVDILHVGYNQIFAFVFDKAGNRSLPPNNRILIERLPHYIYQVAMPIIFK